MAFPGISTQRSFSGSSAPTFVASAVGPTDLTIHLSSVSSWYEVDVNGQVTANPLGTSGPFEITLDFGTVHEEKVLCSSLNISTGMISVWTDGTNTGRGYDGTTPQSHSVGSSTNPNAFPSWSATQALQTNQGLIQALQDASNALSVANSKVSSVSAGNGTISIGGTGTAPTVSVGTVPYSQISGTPSSLPPSGSASGDLTGTYPGPTLASTANVQSIISAVSPPGSRTPSGSAGGDLAGSYPSPTLAPLVPSPAGTFGSTTKIPVITTDSKGRVTSVSEVTPATDAPSGPAGGSLAGTYPNPSIAASGVTANTYGSASSVPVFAVGSDGRITLVSNTSVQIAESQVTNLVTDLSGKASTATTISAGTGLSGGGDLSANRTLSIATLSPSPAGTYGTASAVPAVTVNAQGQVTSVATNTVNDTTKLPLAGGTMSGNIAMNSVARMTGLLRPSSLGQPMRVDEASSMLAPGFYTQNPVVAWSVHPDTANASLLVSATSRFVAITVPYDVTVSGVRLFISTPGSGVTAGQIALMNATTTLAAVSAANAASAFGAATASVQSVPFTSTISLTAGTYWVAFSVTATTTYPSLSCYSTSGGQNVGQMGQTPTTNSLATSRYGAGITIPAVGSSLTTTPSHNVNQSVMFALY